MRSIRWIRRSCGHLARSWPASLTVWLLALVVIPAAHAHYLADGDLTEMSIEDLMSVEVTTVSRKAQRLSDSAAAVFVITNEDIRRSGVTSIAEALRMVPGLEVARISANSWAITARGFNGQYANKLLVLMDGRSVYDPLYSGVFWNVQDALLEDVARIEVIRGPGASLWGANAVNGVINIITKPAAETQGGLATGGFGNEEKAFGALRYGGKIGNTAHYRLYGKYFDRDDSESLQGGEAHDGWNIARGGGRIDWRFSDQDELTVQGDYYDGEVGNEGTYYSLSPPYATPLIESSPVSGGNLIGRWQRQIAPDSDLELQAYVDRAEWEIPLVKETRDTVDVDFQHRFGMGKRQEILWGLGYRWTRGALDVGRGVTFDDEDRRDQLFSLFVQDNISLLPDRLSLTIGSKFEHNDYTGLEVQPNIRLLWLADDRNTFWSAVSRAVRTPGMVEHDARLTQQVIPGTPIMEITLEGNKDYRSETVTAYEAGYRWKAH
jgi:iron complex outermembrane receptor protein